MARYLATHLDWLGPEGAVIIATAVENLVVEGKALALVRVTNVQCLGSAPQFSIHFNLQSLTLRHTGIHTDKHL